MASARKYPSWHEIHRDPFQALARIKPGLQDCLYLGNLDAKRDWGHARDFVEAQWLMLQHPQPEDFVIANGEQHSVREFVEAAARELGVQPARIELRAYHIAPRAGEAGAVGGQRPDRLADLGARARGSDGRSVTPKGPYPGPQRYLPLVRRRPANSRLDNSKLTAAFGLTPPSWDAMLKQCIQEIGNGEWEIGNGGW